MAPREKGSKDSSLFGKTGKSGQGWQRSASRLCPCVVPPTPYPKFSKLDFFLSGQTLNCSLYPSWQNSYLCRLFLPSVSLDSANCKRGPWAVRRFEYAWPLGSGTIWRCDLIEVGMALLEELCYYRWALRPPMHKLRPVWNYSPNPFLLFSAQRIEFSAPPAHGPAHCLASQYDDSGLNL